MDINEKKELLQKIVNTQHEWVSDNSSGYTSHHNDIEMGVYCLLTSCKIYGATIGGVFLSKEFDEYAEQLYEQAVSSIKRKKNIEEDKKWNKVKNSI